MRLGVREKAAITGSPLPIPTSSPARHLRVQSTPLQSGIDSIRRSNNRAGSLPRRPFREIPPRQKKRKLTKELRAMSNID